MGKNYLNGDHALMRELSFEVAVLDSPASRIRRYCRPTRSAPLGIFPLRLMRIRKMIEEVVVTDVKRKPRTVRESRSVDVFTSR